MSSILSALGNHLWQSTVVAAVAGLLTLMIRQHGAHVRYWVWFTASVKFLVPFSLLISLGSAVRWPTAKPIAAPPSMVVVASEIAQPFTISTPVPLGPSPVGTMRQYVPTLLFIIWIVGFLIIVAVWARSWWRMRAVIRGASPVILPPNIDAMASPGLLEPSVFGIFRSVLLVPQDIQERLSEEQLDSVVAHEMCHIRRRDNLLSSIHMTVAAIFWFYPLMWWLGARLLHERERACDEQVIRQGRDPHVYAEGILEVCKSYLESPLRCASGVSGANLQRRIQGIISGSAVQKLNLGRMLILTVSAIAALVIPFAAGIVRGLPLSQEITRPANTPKWEAVSIKRCGADVEGGRRNERGPSSPDRLRLDCQTAKSLIFWSYVQWANGHFNPFSLERLTGGPAWIDSELYQIDAKAEMPQRLATLNGPMFQAILEDRFKLRIHRETREIPVYSLTVVKEGAKLQPFTEGSCIALDFNEPPTPPVPKPGQPLPLICGVGRGSSTGYDLYRATMEDLARELSFKLDRKVIDRTGRSGLFNIHLQLAPSDPHDATDASDVFDSMQSEIRNLGLKLEASKGPGEFLVIDSIERPTEN